MSQDQKDRRRADLKAGQSREREHREKGPSTQRGSARSPVHVNQGSGQLGPRAGVDKQQQGAPDGRCWALQLLGQDALAFRPPQLVTGQWAVFAFSARPSMA